MDYDKIAKAQAPCSLRLSETLPEMPPLEKHKSLYDLRNKDDSNFRQVWNMLDQHFRVRPRNSIALAKKVDVVTSDIGNIPHSWWQHFTDVYVPHDFQEVERLTQALSSGWGLSFSDFQLAPGETARVSRSGEVEVIPSFCFAMACSCVPFEDNFVNAIHSNGCRAGDRCFRAWGVRKKHAA